MGNGTVAASTVSATIDAGDISVFSKLKKKSQFEIIDQRNARKLVFCQLRKWGETLTEVYEAARRLTSEIIMNQPKIITTNCTVLQGCIGDR